MLAGVVSAAVGYRRVLRQRAEHDDLSLPLEQRWQRSLGAVQRAVEVHRHDPLEHCQPGVGDPATVSDAGIVDEDVDAPEALDHQRQCLLHRLGVGDVATQAEGIGVVMAVQMLNEAVQRRLIQIEDRQPRASLGHAHRERATDAGTTAGDDDYLAIEHLADEYLAAHAELSGLLLRA